MENVSYENSTDEVKLDERQQLNRKIELAKKILADSWIDMDAEYKFTRKSAIISALLAIFFVILNIVVTLLVIIYHTYLYENRLDNIKSDLQKYYYSKIVDFANHYNNELDKVSNIYHNYVLHYNPNSKIIEDVKNRIVKIKTEEEVAKIHQDSANEIITNYSDASDFSKNILPILLPFILFSLFVIILLLRHQKKLLSEVRYFSHMKYQIRLFSNLLDASQYVAAETDDCEKVAKYVEETFTSIREQLLLIGNSQHHEENQNADNDNAVLVKILDLFATQQNNKPSQ